MRRYWAWFHLADRLGKHLHEVMGWDGPVTHRQFVAWLCWLDAQWNVKDKTTCYLMQIATECRRQLVKNPAKVTIDQLHIDFKKAGQKRPGMSREQATALAKSRWLGLVGGRVTVINEAGPNQN